MSLLISIVNDQDEIIGFKDREELDLATDIYRVSALWVTNSAGEILLAQRSFKKNNAPGRWGPAVAGTVEKDETYESNIYKEAEEELGLTGLTFELGPKNRYTGDRNYFAQIFTVVIDQPVEYFKPRVGEVEKVQWISRNNLMKDLERNPDMYLSTTPKLLSQLT